MTNLSDLLPTHDRWPMHKTVKTVDSRSFVQLHPAKAGVLMREGSDATQAPEKSEMRTPGPQISLLNHSISVNNPDEATGQRFARVYPLAQSEHRNRAFLPWIGNSCRFCSMTTLTVEEAGAGLERWVERALAGEKIQILAGNSAVELRPAKVVQSIADRLTAREALRCLQEEGRLAPERADQYLREVREERLAAEDRRPHDP